MLPSDSPVDLATATNSPRPKTRGQASAAFPFRPSHRWTLHILRLSYSWRPRLYLLYKDLYRERLELKGALLLCQGAHGSASQS